MKNLLDWALSVFLALILIALLTYLMMTNGNSGASSYLGKSICAYSKAVGGRQCQE